MDLSIRPFNYSYTARVINNPASSKVEEFAKRNAPITDDLFRLILSH